MKIKELLKNGIYVLKEKNIENSNLKARLLLAFLLNKPKEFLITHDTDEVPIEFQKKYYCYLDRLLRGEPIQYIIHKQEFMGLNFYVDENVLIPQPDTEILVQAVQKYINHINGKEISKIFEYKDSIHIANLKILDLCTGSGAIAVSLKRIFSSIDIYASDISEKALEVAKYNAIQNEVSISFLQSNLFEKIEEKFDIIVSNPPYIETSVIETLSKEVQNEPHIALDGGKDGLNFYRKIAIESKKYLKENGMLFLEIGYDQKVEVIELLRKESFNNIICLKDYAENDRVIIASV